MAPVSWSGSSGLPEELQEMILRQPTDVVNLYHYRDVCRSWRSIADKLFASSPPQLLAYKKRNKIVKRIRLFNIFTGDSSSCKIPKLKTGDGQPLLPRSVYSWHRWFVMDCSTSKCSSRKYRAHHIFLYNPFSRARIRLPAFTINRSLDTKKRKFVVSSEPTNPSSIRLAIRDGHSLEKLMFWKRGNKEWIVVEMRMWIVDIISYKGGFCALDWNRNFIQFELSPLLHVRKIPTRINVSSYPPIEYLAESLCGDLLLVHRSCHSDTSKFRVYKLDWERMVWDEITSLGDEAIFLGRNKAVCIRAGDSAVYRHNCIYFTGYAFTISGPKEDFGVYDMGNKTIGRFPHFFPCHRGGLRYRWFTTQT